MSPSLGDVLAVFRKRLFLPDPGMVEVLLAAWVANLLPDDPLWLLMVGPPSSGKTEAVMSLRGLPNSHVASDLSLAGLLTLGGRDDESPDPSRAGRGLLRDLGVFGVILAPELSTLIAESRRDDSKVFGALREVATDRRYSRRIGGREVTWEGKAGFLGCVTEAVDEIGMGALGERFLVYRVPQVSEQDDLDAGLLALSEERGSVADLRDVISTFLDGLTIPTETPRLEAQDKERLTLLGSFATRCRSTVIWDRHVDGVADIPQAERSPRLLRGCAQLLRSLRLIGCDEHEAWRVVRQVALGSIRTRKRRVLSVLLTSDLPMLSGGIAGRARLPETSVRRDLAEMDAFGIVEQVGDRPTSWVLSATYRTWWSQLLLLGGGLDLSTLQPAEPAQGPAASFSPRSSSPSPTRGRVLPLHRESIGDLAGEEVFLW
jgi:hypothetical protein